jgi:hypothetical protein
MIESGHPRRCFEAAISPMNWQQLISILRREIVSGVESSLTRHVQLCVGGCHRLQKELLRELKGSTVLDDAGYFGWVEHE